MGSGKEAEAAQEGSTYAPEAITDDYAVERMTPTEVYYRLISEADGNPLRALQVAAAAICELAAGTSCGFLRAAPYRSVRAPKPAPEAIDIPDASEDVP